MAKTTVTHITDDLDGSTKDVEEISFALFNGTAYTIDLSKKNLAAFEKALKPYLSAATKVPNGRGSSSSRRSRPAGIRAWAREQGFEGSDRGRVSSAIIEQYEAAE